MLTRESPATWTNIVELVHHLQDQPGALWQVRAVDHHQRLLNLNLNINGQIHLVEVAVVTDLAQDDFVRIRIPVGAWSEDMARWVVHAASMDLMAPFGAYAITNGVVGFQWCSKVDQTHVGSVDVHIIELGSVAQGHLDFARTNNNG